MTPIHGALNFNNLLHIEHAGRVYHVAVSGDGWKARCIELGIEAEGGNQAQTLDRLAAKVTYHLGLGRPSRESVVSQAAWS